jgi:hypothetical protein
MIDLDKMSSKILITLVSVWIVCFGCTELPRPESEHRETPINDGARGAPAAVAGAVSPITSEPPVQSKERPLPSTELISIPSLDSKIRFDADRSMLPPSWQTQEINVQLSPVSNMDLQHKCADAIIEEFKKYPSILITANLRFAIVVRSLTLGPHNAGIAGTNSRSDVFLSTDYTRCDMTEIARRVKSAFSHEFSSILLRNHKILFDAHAWEAENPRDFKYVGEGADVVGDGRYSTVFSVSAARHGFYCSYAEASMEEDFNCVAQHLFDGAWPDDISVYPHLKRKFDLAIEFYHKMDPVFTSEFFDNIRLH